MLSQIGHIPFNLWILDPLLEHNLQLWVPAGWRLPATALALGLSAGVFEEVARYAMYRWWRRDARSWSKGLLLGAGHGGIEAIILGALVLLTFINMVAVKDMDLSTLVTAEELELAQRQVEYYWSAPWYTSMLGAVERAFTIPFHIAASVLVLQVFTRKQSRWLWLAIGWHAFIDAIAVYAINTWGAYITEAIIGGSALLNIGIILVLRQPDPEPTEIETAVPLPGPISFSDLGEIEETPEMLEDTRYN